MQNEGYKIQYTKDYSHNGSYLGIDTQSKIIFAINAKQGDINPLEKILYQADLLYSKTGTDPNYKF
jgi:hypothetical protein